MAEGAPDYFKRILLYGLYKDVATPLACDEQGRLIFIPEQVSPFDKSGTVLSRESFESGLVHSTTGAAGTGASVVIESDEAAFGGQSCKMTGGTSAGSFAQLIHYFHPRTFDKLGIEWSARFEIFIERLELWLYVYTGAAYYFGKLRLDYYAGKWQLYDYDSGAFVDILTGVTYSPAANNFYRFKITVDAETGLYHQFIHPQGVVDLSLYQMDAAISTTPPKVKTQFMVYGFESEDGYVLLDDLYFTQDES